MEEGLKKSLSELLVDYFYPTLTPSCAVNEGQITLSQTH